MEEGKRHGSLQKELSLEPIDFGSKAMLLRVPRVCPRAKTCPVIETPQLVEKADEGSVPGRAAGTRGVPSLIKVP